MSVNLSPIYGAGAQLFNDDGTPLAGGFIYTYSAGTTTPLATYTDVTGNIAHTNPIELDASGRVPSGEIWLTSGNSYKFVVKTSADVLIGTFDNINVPAGQGYVTATQGQTIVTVPFTYTVGQNTMYVFVNGSKQVITLNYTETNSTTVTFVSGLNAGDIVEFIQ